MFRPRRKMLSFLESKLKQKKWDKYSFPTQMISMFLQKAILKGEKTLSFNTVFLNILYVPPSLRELVKWDCKQFKGSSKHV